MIGQVDIQAVIDAAVGVGGIVAAVLDQVDAEQPDLAPAASRAESAAD